MSLSNLIFWSAAIITALAGASNIDSIQEGIWKAQAKLIYESRTEKWGTPKFFNRNHSQKNAQERSRTNGILSNNQSQQQK
ncbi:MAG: hypothetical protein ACXWRE_09505 [Pseudobdellovibrionaceae bacterium]